jgi:MSHA biogenesis protein MshJ
MKAALSRLSQRVDALTLRERVLVFAALAGAILFLAYTRMLNPLYVKQQALSAQIHQQRNNIAGIDMEISQRVQAYGVDPDAPTRLRLQAVKGALALQGGQLLAMQKGLVPPEKIALLIETMLKANGRLRLVSMKTLPVSGMSEATPPTATIEPLAAPAGAAAAAAPAAARPAELLYRHGVEIAVQGNYLDLVSYMVALESMPTQLFWGKARLDVEHYPTASLSLTLYTLSLDMKWMKL